MAYGKLFARFKDARYHELEIRYLNRALSQVTGGTPAEPPLAADGRPVRPLALPESYNTIADLRAGKRYFAPSPITPLNWSKACLRLALQALRGPSGASKD